jgi:signal transduction histidine kinase/CheY-like chemotaxis protein
MLAQREPVRILVVDDEEIMLKLACDALRSQGHEVTGTSRPLEALDKLRHEKFDFILTDIKMPGMDGMELIQSAHRIDPSMGAIFMTGYASLDTAKRAIQEGAYDYILKPFDLQEIRSAIARAIQKRSQSIEDGRKEGLSQLFDLNRILYTAGDSESLLKLSLELALVQSGMGTGIILYWDKRYKQLQLFRAKDPERNVFVQATAKVEEKLLAEWSELNDIVQVRNLKSHPLLSPLERMLEVSPVLTDLLDSDQEAVIVPLRKADSVAGMIILCEIGRHRELSEQDLKLLAILGIQTAISLENLTLLVEAQESYRELQNLQEQIINLERMATQGKISAEIGHELNNYLTAIMGNFELLSMKMAEGQTQALRTQLDSISANLQKIQGFAEGLLDFSSLRMEKAECDINGLIERTLVFIKPQNTFKNISLASELAPDIPPLVVDAGQIQQVLYNLLKNGADAMGKRKGEGGTITLGTSHHPEEGTVEIWVRDTGKGMSNEELQKVFQGGFTTKESGHGMGLSICKKIIDAHHGTIQVESQPGRGTCFRVRLPLPDQVGR